MNMRRCVLACALFSLLGLDRPAAAQFARVFVAAKTGNDSNACNDVASPCRTLQRGVDTAAAGGEVIALESGGYGPATISRAVSIEASSGVTAFVHPASGDAVTIAAGSTDRVQIRGLLFNGGFSHGIVVGSVGVLQVDNCTIAGFTDSAILFSSGGKLLLADSIISGNGANAAVFVTPSGTTPVSLTVERCRIQDNRTGIAFAIGTTGTIRDCVISGSQIAGIASVNFGAATTVTNVTVENCVLSHNAFGFDVESGTVRCSNCVITNNTTGLFVTGGAHLLSRGNNTFEGNATPGAFTGTYLPQ
jgi:nitrous oxidase accessory protein NosD